MMMKEKKNLFMVGEVIVIDNNNTIRIPRRLRA